MSPKGDIREKCKNKYLLKKKKKKKKNMERFLLAVLADPTDWISKGLDFWVLPLPQSLGLGGLPLSTRPEKGTYM